MQAQLKKDGRVDGRASAFLVLGQIATRWVQ
jgi:hypothetical protein